MNGKNKYNKEHTSFVNYLMERFDGDKDEVARVVITAERILPNTLHDYFGTTYQSIYEILELNEIEEFRRKIKIHPILKGIDINEEPRYTEVLKWYRLWLKSQYNNVEPIPLPGEYGVDCIPTPSNLAEPPYKNIQLTTIFLEGEEGKTQPIIYRQRNMELRKACIEYFRSLHNGHIICECCGFEFAAHYEIDDDYIEVHHRFPFGQTEGEHLVDATKDLVPLCANCHRMIHHGMGGNGNCMSLEELKSKLK